MSYFAEIDPQTNTVIRVIVADKDFIDTGLVGNPKNWIETSLDGSIGGIYAGIGDIYAPTSDTFIPINAVPTDNPQILINNKEATDTVIGDN